MCPAALLKAVNPRERAGWAGARSQGSLGAHPEESVQGHWCNNPGEEAREEQEPKNPTAVS